MRWMVTGSRGMLGQDLVALLAQRGQNVLAVDKSELDITDPAAVAHLVDKVDVVVNVAAHTAVDKAESEEAAAFTINATGPQILARRTARIGAKLVQVSTDYVFSGDAVDPYEENDVMNPKGAYGRTKAAGEWAVRAETDDYYIVRTAWLYGAQGNCFPKTMARLASERDALSVVTDEVGQPTWTVDLADLIYRMVEANIPSGTYHGTSSGKTNWWNFTREIVSTLGKDPAMVGETTAAAFNRPAPRPHFSVLSHGALRRAGIEPIGDWKDRWEAAAPSVLAEYLG
ncbi:dTDP-4-dehydrorhamnose reductase [Actinotignum sanguinis]|uniref:dTDP-4-dehydrorhamnose reductase n=1 Tax=Actinotignum sanguinis TaxID=1445614 RepID=UPI00237D34CA|nr:dTDP-4-dehydrorhamnose reductase [Actinotignum sanguinis]MDE1552414.1 dTDP-4-dehydrorhamnose reductase [Actinotignum sanguinis]MDE1565082.1 dTDP-4-dehydrorhamnose reductase [Actinotignum sanguinis]MDE1576493.1 dTDP-4-dehydrorhamnose reductase [Actinotignum sanguinis]MDE1641942.1 dTDP-4-dehydrorhamnose reductase [Actinotignum sanguinis]MDK7196676.1 dTDP-4-dehydrorhamnose reductase [Actinotignum sanguinis]